MLDTWTSRGFLSNLTRPVAKILLKKGVSATSVTWLGLALGLFIVPALYFQKPLVAIFLLFMSGYCDAIDGTMARISSCETPKGAMLDILFDRIVEWSVIIGLYMIAPDERSAYCLAMLGSILFCITTFLAVGIFTPNNSLKSFHYSPGLIERAEAFAFFAAMMLLPALFAYLAVSFTLLTLLTAFIRVVEFQREK